MEALVRHLIDPFIKHADAVDLNVVEGDAAYILELTVHDEDRPTFTEDDGRVLRHVRTILSAAAGSKKATIELVGDDAGGAEE